MITLTNCWSASNGTAAAGTTLEQGIDIAASSGGVINGVNISNSLMTNNKGAGITLRNGANVLIQGCQVYDNSTIGSAVRSGIEVSPNVSNFIIAGNTIGSGGLFGGANNQQYGILIAAGASVNYAVYGNLLVGNVTGGMSNLATANVSGKVWGNPGYQTAARGQGQINSGASSAVVNHGLSVTPNIFDFILQQEQSKAAVGIADFWVSATTSTTFTVVSNVVTTGNFLFVWDVRSAGNQNA
jgi:hypothetical protein